MTTLSALTFSIPPEDYREFSGLPQAARDRIHWLLQCMRSIAGSKAKTTTCKQIAKDAGKDFNTIYCPWRRYRDSGDWRQLLDKRRTPEFWVRDDAKVIELPAAFIDYWKSQCELFQRAFKPAHRQLIADWKAWKRGNLTKAIPGFDRCPPAAAGSAVPKGWTYSNLLNHVPTDIEVAAARQGRTAALKLVAGVSTTRVGSYPFAEIQFDDMWHDFEVNVPGRLKSCRLLEFGAIEAFTTYLFRPGLKPRLHNMETGKAEILNGRDFHLYLVNWLLDYGWHPSGTVFNVENATASIDRRFEQKLLTWSNGLLTTKRAGMSGAPAVVGGWAERAKGNPNAKALKEGMGKLIHNQLSNLPGQIGMNRDNLPASFEGRRKDNEMLLALAAQVPALAGKLQLGFLDLKDAVYAINEVYDLLNFRTDHDIEGWEECGMIIDKIRFSKHSDDWYPADQALDLLEPHERTALSLALKIDPTLRRRFKLSPGEGLLAHQERLIKLPHEAVPDLLGDAYGEVLPVKDGLIKFKRAELGSAPLRFKPIYQDADGFRRRIENGSEVLCHLNPWKPDWLYLSDAKSHRFLGRTKRDLSVTRGDVEAINAMHGAAQRDYKDAVAETAMRQGVSRIPYLKANTAVLRNVNKPTDRDRALGSASFDSGELLDAQEELETAGVIDAACAFDPADLLD